MILLGNFVALVAISVAAQYIIGLAWIAWVRS